MKTNNEKRSQALQRTGKQNATKTDSRHTERFSTREKAENCYCAILYFGTPYYRKLPLGATREESSARVQDTERAHLVPGYETRNRLRSELFPEEQDCR